MNRTLLCAALSSISLIACTDALPGDELADETEQDGETGKGDSADQFTFFTQRPDVGACTADHCSFFVARANRSFTDCLRDQGWYDTCEVDLDLTGTALTPARQAYFRDQMWNEVPMLVRGELVASTDGTKTVLAATELWLPNKDTHWPEGTFVRLRDNGIQCVTAPCANIGEYRINSSRSAEIHEYDLDYGDAAALQSAAEDIATGPGVIVAGERYYRQGGDVKGRRASQFYTQITK